MNFDKMVEALKLEARGDAFIGEKDGYYYSGIFRTIGNLYYHGVQFIFTKPLPKKIASKLKKALKTKVQLSSFANKHDLLFVAIPVIDNEETYQDNCQNYLNMTINFLQANKLYQSKQCYICCTDKEQPLESRIYDDTYYVFVHPECEAHPQLYDHVKRNVRKTSYLPISITLALLGALIGFLPEFLIMIYEGVFVEFLFGLVPIGALIGYRLGRGPRKKYMLYIIILISVFVVIGVNIVYLLYLANYEHVPLYALILYADGYLEALLEDLGLSLIFCGFGIVITWGFIYNSIER